MKSDFVLAFNEVLEEKGLPKDVIIEALQAALASAYRRHVNASNAQHVDADIDAETGKVTIYAEKEIVDSVQDPRTEVSLNDALKVDADASLGGMVVVESTPKNFGRVAAQTARQVIQQRIREAERDAQFKYFSRQLGEIMSGVIQAVNPQHVTLGLEMKAEGVMPRAHQIPGERFRVHDRVRALLLEVKSSPRGPQIVLSRAHRNFLRRLLENEVPEIYHGMVEIRSIAREPGQRSKVAVAALQPGVDPVGACVGIRGVRIQAIVRELNDEKIDVIEWSNDAAVYIAKALSPARVSGVYLNDQSKGTKTATVVVPEDQLSLAIGRDGQNARLAAKLTSWRIDIKSLPEAASDALNKLLRDPEFTDIADAEGGVVPQIETILAKKAEGRPVTPEEYHALTQFVDRIERGVIRQQREEKRVEEERVRAAREKIPAGAFEIPLEKFDISDRVYAVISEAGAQTVGDLMMQMFLDPDSIWKLSGMGPKAMAELEAALERLTTELRAAEQPEEALVAEAEAPVEEVLQPAEAVEAAPAEGPVMPEEAAALAEAEAPIAEKVEQAVAEGLLAGEVAAPEAGAVEAVPVEAAPVEQVAPAEAVAAEVQPEVVSEPAVSGVEGEQAVDEEDEEGLLESLLALRTDELEYAGEDEEDEEDETSDRKKKKKKKRKKFVEVEYDPDQDVLLVKKIHKRPEDDWL